MASSPADSSTVIKILCDHQGCLDFKTLEGIIASLPNGDLLLQSVLSDDSKVVIKRGHQKAAGGQIISPDSLVLAKTSLRVCVKKPSTCECDSLHLCKCYVRGNCSFGDQCHDPHSLAEAYNAELLKKHGLQDLTEKQLFQLLLQNDQDLLPGICAYYNKGGFGVSCKFPTNCENLHVCEHYFQGDCKYGASCRRAHKINEQERKAKLHGCSGENMQNLQEIYRNKFIIMSLLGSPVSALPGAGIYEQQPSHKDTGSSSGSQSTSRDGNNEICLYSIRGRCEFKEKCNRVHWTLPYRWQVLDTDGKTWKDLRNMEDIEKAYCDPGHDTDQPSLSSLQSAASPSACVVNFMMMPYEGSPVRRLSTASSVSKPPHFILTTQWLWYWKDDTGRWLEFGQGDSDTLASVTSETLEKMYLADRDEIPFSAGNHQHVLHFKGKPGTPQMYQENLQYKTKREVRRRPRFVSANDVKMKVESPPLPSTSSSTAESFPPHWDKSALPDFGYKRVLLSISVEDYRQIETLFKRTMPQSVINNVHRIQNAVLWDKFQRQKKLMKVRNGGTDVNELQLFHGTDKSRVEDICDQNFDWRVCGDHGTAYGKGSYFARDASYSHRYASITGSTNKFMFVALVLVGEYCRGSKDIPLPPLKGNSETKEQSQTRYDSCVDNECDPNIYVIFEKDQIYPEYIINYSYKSTNEEMPPAL